jgi:hypothetical protein
MLVIGLTALLVTDSLRSAPPDLTAEPAQFSIAIQHRRVDPARQTIRATQGQVVELAFTADESVVVHLHGYDQMVTVQPGSAAMMRLHARTAGRFAIEAHGFGSGADRSRRHVVLLYLEIHPR